MRQFNSSLLAAAGLDPAARVQMAGAALGLSNGLPPAAAPDRVARPGLAGRGGRTPPALCRGGALPVRGAVSPIEDPPQAPLANRRGLVGEAWWDDWRTSCHPWSVV